MLHNTTQGSIGVAIVKLGILGTLGLRLMEGQWWWE